MKFRKKPVVIEAIQFDGDVHTINVMCNAWPEFNDQSTWKRLPEFLSLIIHTLEGDHHANSGDWIIKGIKGEFYPCKPDIFEATYEAVK